MTFRLRRVFGIVMGVLLLSLSGTGQTNPQNSGIVSGRVFSNDGTPAVGIRVAALLTTAPALNERPSATNEAATNGALMSLAQTDAEGRFRLENISPGAYYLVAGPLDAPVYFPGVAGQASAKILTVTAGAVLDGQDFHITVPFAVKVRGRVIRDGHHAGTQIILNRNSTGFNPGVNSNFNTTIAPDGSFEFPAVRPGIYQARVNPGVGSFAITVVVADTDITNLEIPIPLSAVDIAVTVDVTLEGGGVLPRFQLQFMPTGPLPANTPAVPPNFSTSGRIISLNGAKTQLTLPTQTFPQMEYRVRAMPSGNSGLPEGYVIQSMMAGSVDLLTQPVKISAAMPTDIAIKLGVAAQPPWVRVQGKITGIDADHPAPGTIALQGQTPAPLSAPVLADGTFEFPMVLPGTYQARLTPATDQFSRSIVVQREDPTRVEIPLLIPSFKVSGRTNDVTPPNKFLRATLMPEPSGGSTNRPSSSAVAADGSFAFPAVQPGTYRAYIAICESDVCMSSGGTVITVDRNIENLSVSSASRDVPPPVNIAQIPPTFVTTTAVGGTVIMENGALMPRFRLKFTVNSVTRSVSVDQRLFTAALPPGDHRVSIADLPAGFEVRSIADGTSDLQFWPLTMAPAPAGAGAAPAAQRIRIVLGVTSPAPWVRVSGHIVGSATGKVTSVELTGKILVDTLKASVGPDGSFEFPMVLPDTYSLRLQPGGNAEGQTITVGAAGLSGLDIDGAIR